MRRNRWLGMLTVLSAMVLGGAAYAASPVLREIEEAFVALAEQVRPCVVNIDVVGPEREMPFRMYGYGGPDMEFFGPEDMERFFRFFNVPPDRRERSRRQPRLRRPDSLGSGFIYDTKGHIITNNHVVNKAEKITVRLHDGKEYEAKVIGSDPDTDLAVIKIEPDRPLPAATLGSSSNLKVGQFAVAVGSPRSLEGSFSFGHITALGRGNLPLPLSDLRFEDFIQTDAAINLGNSGGPLCNLDGHVIGINIAIVGGAENIGFAIPIDRAKEVVPELISKGKVTRGYLGVEITDLTNAARAMELPDVKDLLENLRLPDAKGAYVHSVSPGTPAERAGLQDDDVIRKVDGVAVNNADEVVAKISNLAPGSRVKLEVWRKGSPIEVEVRLDEYPGSKTKARYGQHLLGLYLEELKPDTAERLRLDPSAKGVVVREVEPDSPAEDAGIEVGDVITEVAQEKVASLSDFRALINQYAAPGKSLLLRVLRDGESIARMIKIPADYQAR